MNSVQIFQNNQFGQIRVATNESGEPMFCLTDLCKALSLTNPTMVKGRLDDDLSQTYPIPDSFGREQLATFVTEAGMYSVILRSDSPIARPMQKWVTSEVLPSIRKHGAYLSQQKIEEILTNPDTIIKLATELKTERAEKERLLLQSEIQSEQLKLSAPKVEFYDRAMSSEGLISINKIALDLGMSAIKLNRILQEKRVQYREGETYLLYSKYRDCGYATLRPHPYIDSLGRQQTRQHLYWTERGREFIVNLLKSD